MLNIDTLKKLQNLIEKENFKDLIVNLQDLNYVDIAEFIEVLTPKDTLLVFRLLPKDAALHVFSWLDVEDQHNIIASMADKDVKEIVDRLWVDDVVDMMEEMPATLVKKVLENASPEIRKTINLYLNFHEDSVGSVMTAEFVELRKHMTVKEAVIIIRKASKKVDIETVYTCFVTNDTRVLQGVLNLKEILFAKDEILIKDLLTKEPILVHTSTDKFDAVKTLMRYDLMALPVTDSENRLVGILTADDAINTLVAEDTEDVVKMSGILPSEKPYMKASIFELAKNRFFWLFISLLTNIGVSFVLDSYSPIYAIMPILVAYIPMLMGSGGNAGSQTSTLIIRGLALDEIKFSDFWKVLFKEFRISFLLGGVLGAIAGLRIYFVTGHDFKMAFIVGFSLLASIFVGKISGALLPLLSKKINMDPALMAPTLVSTIVDIAAIVIFFSIVQILLPV